MNDRTDAAGPLSDAELEALRYVYDCRANQRGFLLGVELLATMDRLTARGLLVWDAHVLPGLSAAGRAALARADDADAREP